ncbi:MAG: hypothetical protein GY906_30985, partial [bacterium]|nr:hypothetical protein [bacterium]
MRNRVLFLFIAMTGLAIASAAQEDVAAPIHQTQEGFITLTTSGGSNVFRGTADFFWSPEALQSTSPNAVQRTYDDEQIVFHHNQSRKQEAFEANISLAAPVLKDRLFAFAFANYDKSDNLEVGANTAEQQTTRQPLWGVHLDWTPSKQHRLRGNFVSDRVDAKLITREFDPEALAFGQANDQGTQTFVTQASSLRYSGVLSDTVQISARLGSRSVDLHNQSERGEECPYAFDNRSGRPQRLGCWLDANIGTESDRRTNFRFDLDWYVGRHALRFGATVESIRYSRSEDYSGGVAYEYHLNGERFDSLSPETDLVRVRTRFENGAYKARSRAAYFQDRWLLSSTLTLDLGVR